MIQSDCEGRTLEVAEESMKEWPRTLNFRHHWRLIWLSFSLCKCTVFGDPRCHGFVNWRFWQFVLYNQSQTCTELVLLNICTYPTQYMLNRKSKLLLSCTYMHTIGVIWSSAAYSYVMIWYSDMMLRKTTSIELGRHHSFLFFSFCSSVSPDNTVCLWIASARMCVTDPFYWCCTLQIYRFEMNMSSKDSIYWLLYLPC